MRGEAVAAKVTAGPLAVQVCGTMMSISISVTQLLTRALREHVRSQRDVRVFARALIHA